MDQESSKQIRLLLDDQQAESYLFDYSADLSEGGIFIRTRQALPLGSHLRVSFTIPDSVSLIEAECEVRWMGTENDPQGRGVGLAFLDLDERSRKVLLQFIQRNLS